MGLEILLACAQENYLAPIVRGVLDQLGDKCDIEAISDRAYLAQYFTAPRSLDITVMDEELFQPEFRKHKLGALFLLCETEGGPIQKEQGAVYLYKYSSMKQLLSKIVEAAGATDASLLESKEMQTLLVWAPAGGSGQTAIALGIASAMAQNGKRVLFLSMDSLQCFGGAVQCTSRLKAGSEKALLGKSDFAYQTIKPQLGSMLFAYVPPFAVSPAFLELEAEHYIHLLQCIRSANDFDVVVVDGPDGLSGETTAMMAAADKVLVVTAQNSDAADKLCALLDWIDCADAARFQFVCNNYDAKRDNALKEEGRACSALDFYTVRHMPQLELAQAVHIEKNSDIFKIALAYS